MSLVPRKKRRPALACEPCRRRKIRCDRQTPCWHCVKANVPWSCLYVVDHRQDLTKAPFDPKDIQFSVFHQQDENEIFPAKSAARAHSQSDPSPDCTRQWSSQSLRSPVMGGTVSTVNERNGRLSRTNPDPPITGRMEIHTEWQMDSVMTSSLDVDEIAQGFGQGGDPAPSADAPYPTFSSRPRGAWYKGRFLGQSHWINFAHKSSQLLELINSHETGRVLPADTLPWTFNRIRDARRAAKEREANACAHGHAQAFKELLPGKPLVDRLVQAYLRTFQTVFEIVDIQSFRAEYESFWNKPGRARDNFCITVLLAASIGSVFCPREPGITRATAISWRQLGSGWLDSTSMQRTPTLETLRIHCLRWLAQRVTCENLETSWMASGALVRMATRLGLHVCPSPNADDEEERGKRRLWGTILEIEVQSSMDCGATPSIDRAGLKTIEPLLSSGKESDDEGGGATPLDEQLAQSSFQTLLMRTLPTRLQIAQLINCSHNTPTFDSVLALGLQLQSELKVCSDVIEGHRMSANPPTAFQTQLFEAFTLRFLVGLYQAFASKSISEPLYNYVRKTCLDSSMALLGHLPHSNDTDFGRLCLTINGTIFDFYTECALILTSELAEQTVGDYISGPGSVVTRSEMKKGIHRYLELAAARISAGEKNVKRFVLVACLLAQAAARADATASEDEHVLTELRSRLQECVLLLTSYIDTIPEPPLGEGSLGSSPTMIGRSEWPQWEDFQGAGPMDYQPQTHIAFF